MAVIYVASPFGGKVKNLEKAKQYVEKLTVKFPQNTYISPLLCFGYLYGKIREEQAEEMCADLLTVCDEAIFCGDWENSNGCKKEIALCETIKLPYTYLNLVI